jgi:hypothetical protein
LKELGNAGDAARTGLGKIVSPASLFIHESAENLVFETQKPMNYSQAHAAAIQSEAEIQHDLNTAGGFAGAEIRSVIPRR